MLLVGAAASNQSFRRRPEFAAAPCEDTVQPIVFRVCIEARQPSFDIVSESASARAPSRPEGPFVNSFANGARARNAAVQPISTSGVPIWSSMV